MAAPSPATHELLSLPAQFWDAGTRPYFDAARRTWHVFSYADVVRILNERPAFSQQYGASGGDDHHPNLDLM